MITEPTTYFQESKDANWVYAMKDKIRALKDNTTWNFVSLPAGKRVIGCKWVYKVKYNSNEYLERCQVRLVAKDYNQKEGIDYNDTFSPVAKMATVRTLLVIATKQKWPLDQMDVLNAFLQTTKYQAYQSLG